jgi:UDP-2,3-diacylglucosamine pyrophosphatase LpxH
MVKVKSLFVSDLHIGVKHNNIKTLLEILDDYEFENLFLVGDIIDMTKMAKKPRWKKSYGKFFKKLINLSKTTNIVYITGNHDYFLREFTPFNIGSFEIVDEYIYKDILLIHGDKFDRLVYSRKWLYAFGAYGYDLVIWIDETLNLKGVLSKKAKRITKRASNYLNDFYETARRYTKSKKCSRVICGHTHMPEERKLADVIYYNCGDFRESSTYIIESMDGDIKLRYK